MPVAQLGQETMKKQTTIDELKKLKEDSGENGVNANNYYDSIGFDQFAPEKIIWEDPSPTLCIFCNAPWTPEMLEVYEFSGYCEACSEEGTVLYIACSECRRIVYRK